MRGRGGRETNQTNGDLEVKHGEKIASRNFSPSLPLRCPRFSSSLSFGCQKGEGVWGLRERRGQGREGCKCGGGGSPGCCPAAPAPAAFAPSSSPDASPPPPPPPPSRGQSCHRSRSPWRWTRSRRRRWRRRRWHRGWTGRRPGGQWLQSPATVDSMWINGPKWAWARGGRVGSKQKPKAGEG
jgi:hypothetical protein